MMHQPRANWTEQVRLPSRSLVAKVGRLRFSVTAVAAATANSGVTVAKDGSLLISEDGDKTIWRVSYK